MHAVAELEELVRARHPLIAIESAEEARVEAVVAGLARRLGKPLLTWSCTRGLQPAGAPAPSRRNHAPATTDPIAALEEVMARVEPALFLFRDLHPWLSRQHPAVVRHLREIARELKESRKTLLLLTPRWEPPYELETEAALVRFPLPDESELLGLLAGLEADLAGHQEVALELEAAVRQRLAQATLGLTYNEAETALARILVRHGRLGTDSIPGLLEEKQRVIARTGLLEFCPLTEDFSTMGGLEGLKQWLRVRERAFGPEARAFGLPAPRGVLLLGVQGCGKSLSAKAAAALWQVPLLRFDAGRLFSSLVGSSEENARRAIAVAESVAPAVLWIDELDKAFAGLRSSGATDSGTTARVFGTLLTWLAEKQAPVFVAATANDLSGLPPELLRKGRFDELFFVDLPQPEERREILSIHLAKRGRVAAAFDLDRLVRAAEGRSGAEIEQAIVDALCEAFHAGHEVTTDDIAGALEATVPLARTMAEQVSGLRQWAAGRARPAGRPARIAGQPV